MKTNDNGAVLAVRDILRQLATNAAMDEDDIARTERFRGIAQGKRVAYGWAADLLEDALAHPAGYAGIS